MSRAYTGTVQASAVSVETVGGESMTVSFEDGSATTGTIAITVTPPGMSTAQAYTDNTYTVGGTTKALALENADLGTVTLTPSSVDAAVTYRMKVWNGE